MVRSSTLALLLVGCWTSSQPEIVIPPVATDVTVELAAVTLADDCGDGALAPPSAAAGPRIPNTASPVEAPADCADDSCGQACEQTSMQLAVRASAGTKPTSIRVKQVDLLDANGGVLGTLAARAPKRWEGDRYVAWNQTIAPDGSVSATYALASPSYDTFGGRWSAHEKRFQLRVTIVVGDSERVVEKQAISPAMLEPAVPT